MRSPCFDDGRAEVHRKSQPVVRALRLRPSNGRPTVTRDYGAMERTAVHFFRISHLDVCQLNLDSDLMYVGYRLLSVCLMTKGSHIHASHDVQ